MVGWMLIIVGLAAAVSPGGSGGEATLRIGRGVIVTAPGGWTSAARIWDVGPDAVSLQKAGALVAFAAEAYAGSAGELLAGERSHLESEFGSFRALPVSTRVVGGDVDGVAVLFTGSGGSGLLEGELVGAVRSGTGVVMLAVAPAGQLRRVQSDLDSMLDTMVIPK